jgi:hypothetical protein
MLAFYSLYKQGTEGDCTESFSFNPSRELKRRSWLAQKGKSREQAMVEYLELSSELGGTQIGGRVSKLVQELEDDQQELTGAEAKVELLHESVKQDNVDLELLAELGVNVKDREGLTSLHHAINEGKPGQVRVLLSLGADVNAQDDMLMTPLHYAAATDSLEITTLLLEVQGINIALVDEDKLLPLDLAGEQTKELLRRIYS